MSVLQRLYREPAFLVGALLRKEVYFVEGFIFRLINDDFWTCSCRPGDAKVGYGSWRRHLQDIHIERSRGDVDAADSDVTTAVHSAGGRNEAAPLSGSVREGRG